MKKKKKKRNSFALMSAPTNGPIPSACHTVEIQLQNFKNQVNPHKTLAYGFTKGGTADDITGFIREFALANIHWKGLGGDSS